MPRWTKSKRPSLPLLLCQPIRGRLFRVEPLRGEAYLFCWKTWDRLPWEELTPERFAGLAAESPLVLLTAPYEDENRGR